MTSPSPQHLADRLASADAATQRKAEAELSSLPDGLMAAAVSWPGWNDHCAGEALVVLASRFGDDPFMNSAIMSSAMAHSEVFIPGLINGSPNVLALFRDPLLRQSVGRNDQSTIASLLKNVLDATDDKQHVALDELLLALQSVGADVHAMALAAPQGAIAPWVVKLDALLDSMSKIAANESNRNDERIAAARLLCRIPKYQVSGVELLSQI